MNRKTSFSLLNILDASEKAFYRIKRASDVLKENTIEEETVCQHENSEKQPVLYIESREIIGFSCKDRKQSHFCSCSDLLLVIYVVQRSV